MKQIYPPLHTIFPPNCDSWLSILSIGGFSGWRKIEFQVITNSTVNNLPVGSYWESTTHCDVVKQGKVSVAPTRKWRSFNGVKEVAPERAVKFLKPQG